MSGRGFTLIELLVVIGIIGVLAAISVPIFSNVKNKAKEAEVKSNLHTIQKALEIYATDNQGFYPPWIYGGDFTDSWTAGQRTWDKLTANGGVEIGDGNATSVPSWVETAGPGDGDALIIGGYLDNFSYPKNPFTVRANLDSTSNSQLQPIAQRSGSVTSQRDIAGRNNNLMWEISGGPPKYSAPLPNGHPGWQYLYPVMKHDPDTNQITGAGARMHSQVMIGNFYYYSLNKNNVSWGFYNPLNVDASIDVSLREPPIYVTGYILVGYGSIRTDGMDVYDVYGDFKEHCRLATSGGGPNQPINSAAGGPDGIPDGAVIALSNSVRVEAGDMTN